MQHLLNTRWKVLQATLTWPREHRIWYPALKRWCSSLMLGVPRCKACRSINLQCGTSVNPQAFLLPHTIAVCTFATQQQAFFLRATCVSLLLWRLMNAIRQSTPIEDTIFLWENLWVNEINALDTRVSKTTGIIFNLSTMSSADCNRSQVNHQLQQKNQFGSQISFFLWKHWSTGHERANCNNSKKNSFYFVLQIRVSKTLLSLFSI